MSSTDTKSLKIQKVKLHFAQDTEHPLRNVFIIYIILHLHSILEDMQILSRIVPNFPLSYTLTNHKHAAELEEVMQSPVYATVDPDGLHARCGVWVLPSRGHREPGSWVGCAQLPSSASSVC